MACTNPLVGFRSAVLNPSGKSSIVFNDAQGTGKQVVLPCGQCLGCRLERSRQWAVRCVHEGSIWSSNCFVTLTYDDSHLPEFNSLVKRDLQLFMKRLRKRFPLSRIRFFGCGEYGDLGARPHYHLILFNFRFPDELLRSVNNRGDELFTSEILGEIWPFGFSTIGELTFESAAYVARYVVKKVNGDLAIDHYCEISDSGEIVSERLPEFVLMSRRPGIGRGWFEKFSNEVYPRDFVVSRGVKVRPPKYYDRLFEVDNPLMMENLKDIRISNAPVFNDQIEDRLRRIAIDKCDNLNQQQLVRSL